MTFAVVEHIPEFTEVRLAGKVTVEEIDRLCRLHASHLLVDLSGLESAGERPRTADPPPEIGEHTEESIAFYAPGSRAYAAAQRMSLYLGRCRRLEIFVNREEALFWLAH